GDPDAVPAGEPRRGAVDAGWGASSLVFFADVDCRGDFGRRRCGGTAGGGLIVSDSMAFKQKKRVKNAKGKYLKPGALAQLRYTRAISKSCTDIGKKRVVLDSKKAKINILRQAELGVHITPVASPDGSNLRSVVRVVDGMRSHKSPATPKTPLTTECDSLSGLESLPMDILVCLFVNLCSRFLLNYAYTIYHLLSNFSPLLFYPCILKVKILCHLHHDQLKAVFHVSRKIRKAVLLARQYYFNFTTPDRSRQEMLNTRTPLPTDHWPFMSKGEVNGVLGVNPQTPNAPRHGPPPPRLHLMDMSQIAAVLFQESALPSRLLVPPGLPRPVCKSVASNRVLFYEDELCQAVAQNKLH
ncbi:hypothetical protein Taro_002997, partial [Colocasia esculenta]|nr:hypothetical protein [Colocasia esculenta]